MPSTTMPYVQLDITDAEAVVQRASMKSSPGRGGALCGVDGGGRWRRTAEKVAKVRAINAGRHAQHRRRYAKSLDCRLLYICPRTMYFDGQGTKPWEPDCTAYAPLNVYGQTKLEGEKAVRRNSGKILYCPNCLGIWPQWKEFYQDHAQPVGKV